ncbi:MAG: TraR/DksA C4-type zinc finger protein [Anaerolineales bacterium]|nr:TraR/DksA C4-type zinc finger protein [Anaerolineales bacterium]
MNIDISQVQAFHGHMCPGLAIGIRVAEKALQEMGERPGDEQVVAIVETNNCAVDAVQFITGCTFGKGNLIHLDYGKNAFRFIRRRDNKAIRIIIRPQASGTTSMEQEGLMKRWRTGTVTDAEKQQAELIQRQRIEWILSAPLDELLEVQEIQTNAPPAAKIFNSVPCDACGEKTMETRLHMLEGKVYCPECYENILLRGN